ncbi:MAG: hypothetical protein MHM6MM_000072 [Cercozoa sp. M6MM]
MMRGVLVLSLLLCHTVVASDSEPGTSNHLDIDDFGERPRIYGSEIRLLTLADGITFVFGYMRRVFPASWQSNKETNAETTAPVELPSTLKRPKFCPVRRPRSHHLKQRTQQSRDTSKKKIQLAQSTAEVVRCKAKPKPVTSSRQTPAKRTWLYSQVITCGVIGAIGVPFNRVVLNESGELPFEDAELSCISSMLMVLFLQEIFERNGKRLENVFIMSTLPLLLHTLGAYLSSNTHDDSQIIDAARLFNLVCTSAMVAESTYRKNKIYKSIVQSTKVGVYAVTSVSLSNYVLGTSESDGSASPLKSAVAIALFVLRLVLSPLFSWLLGWIHVTVSTQLKRLSPGTSHRTDGHDALYQRAPSLVSAVILMHISFTVALFQITCLLLRRYVPEWHEFALTPPVSNSALCGDMLCVYGACVIAANALPRTEGFVPFHARCYNALSLYAEGRLGSDTTQKNDSEVAD